MYAARSLFSPGFLVFCAALGAASWRAPAPGPAIFAMPAPILASTPILAPPPLAPPREETLPAVAPYMHAVNLAELPDGRLAAVWYAGSREAVSDVAIWMSVRDAASWSAPRVIATTATTAAGTGAFVGALGNPALAASGGKLHLFFVSVGYGGWAASSLNHSVSEDSGQTWSAPRKLATSPVFNVSTLARGAPLPLADGGFGLPVYHEMIDKRGEWLRLSAEGEILSKKRLPSSRPALQPSVAALDGRHALAILRDSGVGAGALMAAATDDGGESWRALPNLPIANEDSFAALLRLSDGRLLLAANPAPGKKRDPLALFLSENGENWRAVCTVERSARGDEDFAYPSLVQTRDGLVHLAYARNYRELVHRVYAPDFAGCAP
jgi:predicted neuraminidase